MFRNRRKTIGLFITDHFDDSFQSELCRGVVERAKENDINVAIFSLRFSSGRYSMENNHSRCYIGTYCRDNSSVG